MSEPDRAGHTEALLRRGLLGLAGLGALGTWVELGVSRHWKTTVQLIPWVAVGVVAVAAVLVAARPSRWAVLLARVLGAIAIVAGGFGVFEHVKSNYDAAPLDAVYGGRWEGMSGASRWWHALIESVGPSPSFAPGALALVAMCLLLATVRHPAMGAIATVEAADVEVAPLAR